MLRWAVSETWLRRWRQCATGASSTTLGSSALAAPAAARTGNPSHHPVYTPENINRWHTQVRPPSCSLDMQTCVERTLIENAGCEAVLHRQKTCLLDCERVRDMDQGVRDIAKQQHCIVTKHHSCSPKRHGVCCAGSERCCSRVNGRRQWS